MDGPTAIEIASLAGGDKRRRSIARTFGFGLWTFRPGGLRRIDGSVDGVAAPAIRSYNEGIHQESAEGPSPTTPQQPGTTTGASAGTDGLELLPLTALVAAGFLNFLLRGLAALLGIARCTAAPCAASESSGVARGYTPTASW